jgi:hypothetical protein
VPELRCLALSGDHYEEVAVSKDDEPINLVEPFAVRLTARSLVQDRVD